MLKPGRIVMDKQEALFYGSLVDIWLEKPEIRRGWKSNYPVFFSFDGHLQPSADLEGSSHNHGVSRNSLCILLSMSEGDLF